MERIGLLSAIAGAAALGLALYLFGSQGLSGEARIVAYSSGIFDMDVDRVAWDWASDEHGLRTPVHPLIKLTMTPTVTAVRAVGGPLADPLRAILAIIAASMTAYALLCGLLASQLCDGALRPGAVAALVCAVSFSSILLGSLPETASVSGLSTLLPLVYLNRRQGRCFDRREAITWGLLGVYCIAFTLTQIVHRLIALGARSWLAARARSLAPHDALRAAPWPRVALLFAIFVVTTAAAAQIQSSIYEGTRPFYNDPNISIEANYLRFDTIAEEPLAHAGRLLAQVGIYGLTAPQPAMSNTLSFLRGEP